MPTKVNNITNDPNEYIVESVSNPNTKSESIQDDGGFWENNNTIDNQFKDALHSNNIFSNNEIKSSLFNKTFRYGLFDLYNSVSIGREYLFFTKPDLNIYDTSEFLVPQSKLNEGLKDIPFWIQLKKRKDTVIKMLQNSLYWDDPFNHLLQNQVISNLDVPSLSAETVDTPTNMYGVNYSYRGTSESSDDSPEFSLEFRDNKFLDTYMFFKAYDEYEMLKHHGVIRPSKYYIKNKVLHDQFAIYKFIVGDDMETILYYGKMYGVFPKSLPRDTFSSPEFSDGLKYSIDFKAAFYEDMRPDILADFNSLSVDFYNKQKYQINPYNITFDHADMRPAQAAYIETVANSNYPEGYCFKLKWRGSDQI